MSIILWPFRAILCFALIFCVRFYQLILRPVLPTVCRFEPSCSEYFIESVKKHGPWCGAWRGFRRICRCGPWSVGGYDPP